VAALNALLRAVALIETWFDDSDPLASGLPAWDL
jgi:hypothetical protein